MVHTTPPHEHQQSLPSSPIKGPANESSGRSTSPHGLERNDPDRLAGIWQSLENKGISEKAVNLICASGLRSPTFQLGDCGKACTLRDISILFQHL